jgi:hypothetical protein
MFNIKYLGYRYYYQIDNEEVYEEKKNNVITYGCSCQLNKEYSYILNNKKCSHIKQISEKNIKKNNNIEFSNYEGNYSIYY